MQLRWWIAGTLLLGTGCGPIRSQSVLVDAAAELTAAEVSGGQKHSPYEYTAAEWYLRKAREEQSYADFEAAQHLAEKARACAKLARKVAELFTRAELSGAERPIVEKRGCRAGGSWRADGIDDAISEPVDAKPTKRVAEPTDPEPVDPKAVDPKAVDQATPGKPPVDEPSDPEEEPVDPKKKKKKVVEPADPELPPGEDLPPGEEPQEGRR